MGAFCADDQPDYDRLAAGDYALDWSGTSTDEEDYIGQFTLTSGAGNFTGLLDLNEFTTGVQTLTRR
jgi:hypothetical protein